MYIDPGTGSLVLQIASAVIVTIAASFGSVRRFLGSLLTRRRRED